MSTPSQPASAASGPVSTSRLVRAGSADAPAGSALVTGEGKTTIADSVVTKIAGRAARQISGVHNLGAGASRTFGAIKQRIPGSSGPSITQGVSVEVGERQAAIDLDIVADYGVSMVDLVAAIRSNVISSVQRMTGLEVTEVNVAVDDIYIAGDDSSSEPSRVQ